MNHLRVAGILGLIAGIALIIVAFYQKGRVEDARGDVQRGKDLFSGNDIAQAFGTLFEKKISEYDQPIFWLMVSGITFVIVGSGLAIFCRRKT